jgi:hypothetical protein
MPSNGRAFQCGATAGLSKVGVDGVASEKITPVPTPALDSTGGSALAQFAEWSVMGSRDIDGQTREGEQSGECESMEPLGSEPGFGQIDIALNSAQGLVVDILFVAECDHGIALGLQHLAR